jgi:hypothetical protein
MHSQSENFYECINGGADLRSYAADNFVGDLSELDGIVGICSGLRAELRRTGFSQKRWFSI